MTNVQFIIQYLSVFPGARYTDLTKTLCAWKGKTWSRGTYVRYFTKFPGGGYYNNSTGKVCSPTIYPDNLWYKSQIDGLWYLTSCGKRRIEYGGLDNIWKVRFKNV